ncbi:spore protein [Paenibacillus macquariensis subsp. defensor]|uniref:Small, acid-soluble spore protein, alpha/beta type n=1 Tax=Paenibacillus macquariensis TaxID=948756 RepID=A0ABY1JQR5_9BACL|nr:alpha/beta-type small acid-soluble spore protein [Paenibacillus macquariensis]MEC0092607.1 alpha/beta-type small acid-soluble spore protein [Paenibacillus macquariensis]OAB36551.1 spore protein [Paenibacillus macquariensis subsp. macquariensis]OAB39437.1 spore protein [Paenibacillus macquariensis subsp. defensor]SIQ62145.1 Small, acid-soluble spore protein, alpha/beta type [Paenibacillus macquariensis]
MGHAGQQGRGSRSNNLVVPQATAALHQLKMEAAQELGVQIPQDGYYGNYTSRETGSLGGYITKRLVQLAEQQLSGRSNS